MAIINSDFSPCRLLLQIMTHAMFGLGALEESALYSNASSGDNQLYVISFDPGFRNLGTRPERHLILRAEIHWVQTWTVDRCRGFSFHGCTPLVPGIFWRFPQWQSVRPSYGFIARFFSPDSAQRVSQYILSPTVFMCLRIGFPTSSLYVDP